MKKLIKLLESRDRENILIAYIIIKKKYKYLWIFNVLSSFYKSKLYLCIGPATGKLYVCYDGFPGDDFITILDYK